MLISSVLSEAKGIFDVVDVAGVGKAVDIDVPNSVTGKTELIGFGREYTYLRKHGYSYNNVTKTMSR